MTWQPGFSDFVHDFRGRSCIVTYNHRDPGDWWVAPLNEDGSEGTPYEHLTEAEEEWLTSAIDTHRNEQ